VALCRSDQVALRRSHDSYTRTPPACSPITQGPALWWVPLLNCPLIPICALRRGTSHQLGCPRLVRPGRLLLLLPAIEVGEAPACEGLLFFMPPRLDLSFPIHQSFASQSGESPSKLGIPTPLRRMSMPARVSYLLSQARANSGFRLRCPGRPCALARAAHIGELGLHDLARRRRPVSRVGRRTAPPAFSPRS
jgi:hypothetical protein